MTFQNYNFQTTIFIRLQFLKKCDEKIVKATKKIIVISTDTFVIHVGTKRDCVTDICQCDSHFFSRVECATLLNFTEVILYSYIG